MRSKGMTTQFYVVMNGKNFIILTIDNISLSHFQKVIEDFNKFFLFILYCVRIYVGLTMSRELEYTTEETIHQTPAMQQNASCAY